MFRRYRAVRYLCLCVLLAILASAVLPAAEAKTIQLITDGGGSVGNNYGQVRQLSEDRKRRPNSEEIAAANQDISLMYLAYYPEALDEPSNVELYVRSFFLQEWSQVTRTPAYRNPIQRQQLIADWRARIEAMPKYEAPTIRLWVPVMIQKTRYDLAAETVPVNFVLGNEMKLTSIDPYVRCIKVDKEFSLKSLPIAKSNLDKFFVDNQNNRVPGSTASILVELVLDITGKPQVEGIAKPRCPLAAQVKSISAYEYRSDGPYFTPEAAVPGPLITSFLDSTAAGAEVKAAYDARELPQDAPAEAVTFNLPTHKGLIMLPAGGGSFGQYKNLNGNEVRQALNKYGEFLSIGLQPAQYEGFKLAQCATQNYLTPADFEPYFSNDRFAKDWNGATEFEKRRVAAQFKAEVLPKLTARAVELPQRYLLIAPLIMPEYDFERGGFLFRDLTTQASVKAIYKTCPAGELTILPMADQLRDFWKVDAGAAESALNAIPVARNLGARNIRNVYLATEVELVDLTRVQPKQFGPNVPQPPLRLKIISSTMYADEDLTQKVFSPTLVKARAPVLEAGLPASVAISATYTGPYGRTDQLAALKQRGNFEEWEWGSVFQEQQQRDEIFYNSMRSGFIRDYNNPPAMDTDYTPFFPAGYGNLTNRGYDGLTDEQKTLFKRWSKMQAAAL